MYSLGNCYEKGKGCGKNLPKASEWFGKSARLGNAEAKAKGFGVKEELNKEGI